MTHITICDSCGEECTGLMHEEDRFEVEINAKRMERMYHLCDVCRPSFLRLLRRMVGGEGEAANVNLRTQSVTFATKNKAEAA